ncbi:MAG: 50S ribosomal protein L23, partial [Actinobacteria bacterium]|nr:50S ribosomal protein L23 [Actinomycetota bacterium]
VSLSNNGQYVFLIDRRANRSEIQKLVEETYKVKVVGVNIIRIKNKKRDIKKAVVTLKAGDKINIES